MQKGVPGESKHTLFVSEDFVQLCNNCTGNQNCGPLRNLPRGEVRAVISNTNNNIADCRCSKWTFWRWFFGKITKAFWKISKKKHLLWLDIKSQSYFHLRICCDACYKGRMIFASSKIWTTPCHLNRAMSSGPDTEQDSHKSGQSWSYMRTPTALYQGYRSLQGGVMYQRFLLIFQVYPKSINDTSQRSQSRSLLLSIREWFYVDKKNSINPQPLWHTLAFGDWLVGKTGRQ